VFRRWDREIRESASFGGCALRRSMGARRAEVVEAEAYLQISPSAAPFSFMGSTRPFTRVKIDDLAM